MNILIVDDEPIILNGLKRLIGEWEGFRVVGCADDGETALEWLQGSDVLPDLILTDIFMQYIDGLDLIEQVNRLYPGVKCVILSGHGEFHLAQKAIDLKVSRYITKPVDPSELFSFLETIRAELQTEKKQRLDLLKREQFVADAALYVRDKLLFDLLEGRLLSEEELSEFANFFPFSVNEPFTPGVVRLLESKADLTGRSVLLKTVAVKQLFLETFLTNSRGFVMIKDTRTLVFGMQLDPGVRKEVEDFSILTEHVLGIQIAMAMGETEKGLLTLRSTITDLYEKLESRKAENFIYPFEQERKLRLALRMGKQSSLTQADAEFMDCLLNGNPSMESILQGLYKLLESVSSLFKEMGVPCPSYPPLSQVPVSTAVDRMKKWLQACMDQQQMHKSQDTVEAIDKVTMYMHEHYGDASLSLQQLADLVSLHPNHFTQLFRKNTGLSCMQFLAQLRMDKAKELLHQSDLKIGEIAERVGYENPLYFSAYFKKWVGLNPSEYKERLRTDA
ncbi:response regulator [Ammoniphilus sp. 3BR4]|uniref:response regulator transcription factor n=1 Tax=Ammoniphilus sp. 3BR4 TaxID=3158265 RepID=UPI0034673A2A